MALRLGLDLGTNSIGWAIVDKSDGAFTLVDKGVTIFQEGVGSDKGTEFSYASQRTDHRSARRLIMRRRLRKIETIKALVKYKFCPPLDVSEIKAWRAEKKYPLDEDFRAWLRTDEAAKINPYHYRYLSLTTRLDLTKEQDRYLLGRAFYHLTQRRGFLSNRLEKTKASNGACNTGISELSKQMEEAGYHYLGEYFYFKKQNNEKIRGCYTSRIDHYMAEFNAICEKQEIPEEVKKALYRAIFFQRKLKSQKGLVGNCPFEKNKSRAPISHPEFEEYRMLSFINNIKIKTPVDSDLRFLNTEERTAIVPLFLRKSKSKFDFEDIAKLLAGKKNTYGYYKDKDASQKSYLFNYKIKTTVTGSPFTAQIESVFGKQWRGYLYDHYTAKTMKTGIKSVEEVIHDIWHALFSFDDDDALRRFATERMAIDTQYIEPFINIELKSDYASLSLHAVRKILPFLRNGVLYSHAVFLANIPSIVGKDHYNKSVEQQIIAIIESQKREEALVFIVNSIIHEARKEDNHFGWDDNPMLVQIYRKELESQLSEYFGKDKWADFAEQEREILIEAALSLLRDQMLSNGYKPSFARVSTIDSRIKEYLKDKFKLPDSKIDKLYHPSAIELFPQVQPDKDGNYLLGSPRTTSVRNPMAMRALFRLRSLINTLLKEGRIDRFTTINIEMARSLNDANRRAAIERYQRENEKNRDIFRKDIVKLYEEETGIAGFVPSEDDILKFQLWREQNETCIYTGKSISIAQFIGSNPSFDIEHTIPVSRSYDNSQANVTLCESHFNRSVKGDKMPSELVNHSDILARIEPWLKTVEELTVQIEKTRKLTGDDRSIQYRHYLTLKRDYWRNKCDRFVRTEITPGFKNSQMVDIGVITRYAQMYLSSLFPKIRSVNGITVASFRKLWGVQSYYTAKERVNHLHHAVDAITMACIDKNQYEQMAAYYHKNGRDPKIPFEKPWPNFVADVKGIEEDLLVHHYSVDKMIKPARKVLRVRGVKQYNDKGEEKIMQGDSARSSLHKDIFYAAIKRKIADKQGVEEEKICYVTRKSLSELKVTDVKNIIDDVVRTKVENAISGFKVADANNITNDAVETKEENTTSALNVTDANNIIDDAVEKKKEKAEIASQFKKAIQSNTIWMNEEKRIPINKVRFATPAVTNPLLLKKHRDLSVHDYKQNYYVANDGNYMMAIYEGEDSKGKVKREFELVRNIDAAVYFNNRQKGDSLLPVPVVSLKNNYPLRYTLTVGKMVLLWQDSPAELRDLSYVELRKRLYKIVGMSSFDAYGVIVFQYHAEARPSGDLAITGGAYDVHESYKAKRKLLHTQLNACVEGVDFKLNVLGEIKWLI